MIPSFYVHKCGSLEPTYDKFDGDPRGIVWMWEPPRDSAIYVMAIDPTVGRVGWHRSSRVDEDKLTDNTAIEIIRVGTPDVQVCEYAAPIDFMQTSRIANMLGRVYKGREEDCCVCIIEKPGPGVQVSQTMFENYHYYNQWVWKHLDSTTPKPTKSYGFYASRENNRHLWICSSQYMKSSSIIINSPWFVNEAVSSVIDPLRGCAIAISGKHDDRLKAMEMAVYAAHEWSLETDMGHQEPVEPVKEVDWQATDMTTEQMYEHWEKLWERMSEEP